MKFEGGLFKALNVVADWVARAITINILMIVTLLPIVTIFPAISAGYNMFNDYFSRREPPMIRGYFSYFQESFKRKVILNLLLLVVGFFVFTNIRFYMNVLDDTGDLRYLIGYYISLIIVFSLIIISLYAPSVYSVYPRVKLKLLFKVTFFLAGKFFLRTSLLAFSMLLPFVMLMFPVTLVLFVFAGMSIMIMANAAITLPVVEYLEKLGETND